MVALNKIDEHPSPKGLSEDSGGCIVGVTQNLRPKTVFSYLLSTVEACYDLQIITERMFDAKQPHLEGFLGRVGNSKYQQRFSEVGKSPISKSFDIKISLGIVPSQSLRSGKPLVSTMGR